MVIYNLKFLPEFLDQARKYQNVKKILERKAQLLSHNPYQTCKSELLTGSLKGFRSARLSKSFRIIFTICEECRNRNFQKFIGCSSELCASLVPKTVVFFTIGPHEIAYSD